MYHVKSIHLGEEVLEQKKNLWWKNQNSDGVLTGHETFRGEGNVLTSAGS